MTGERLYRLEPLDASGVFLGLGVVQCALLGAAMFAAVVAISAGLPVVVAAVPLVGAVIVSFGRVSGHPIWEWLPLGAGWLWATVTRRQRWAPPLPLWPSDLDQPPPLPPCLDGLEIIAVDWRGTAELAAVRDRERHTMTALVPVPGAQFVVEPRADQERLLAGWGDVLAQFAGEYSVVSHVSWSHVTRRSGLHRHLDWLADVPPADATGSTAWTSYGELVGDAVGTSTVNELVVSLTVSRDRLTHRRRGSHDADERMRQALATAVDGLLRGLRSAGLDPDAPLAVDRVHALMRTRVDPCDPGIPARSGRLVQRLGLLPISTAGPLVVDTGWRSVRVDGAWHRTWWVAAWPRLPVPPSWLEPFLSADGVTRTMTVTLVPVPTRRSRRRIERDLVKLDSDA
ncbi:MAG TPA: SCO6880 family protein, partial [Acidimicrobiales bacterium]